MKVGLRFGFNHYPAQDFPIFRETTAYRTHPDCPVRCPLYTAKSTFRYTWNQTPVCQDLMPRLVTVNLIFLSIAAAETMADRIRTLIEANGAVTGRGAQNQPARSTASGSASS